MASMLSGISGVHADYSDAEIDGKITELDGKITAEKNARGELENKLSTKLEGMRNALSIEITNRETKDKELDGKISAEAKARTQSDQRLSDRLGQGHEDLEKETRERKEEDTKIREEFAKADKALEKKLTGRDNALAGRIDKLATDTDKGLAKVSALAGLHPLDFDPSNKLNFAVAGGSYNGEHAFALGAFYRPNRNIMISFGSRIAGGENAYNVGLSVKVGKGGDCMSERNATVSEFYALIGRMQEEMNAQKAEMMEQREQIAAQQRKIAELEAR